MKVRSTILLAVMFTMTCMTASIEAQGRIGSFRLGSSFGGNGLLGLLSNEKVTKELEIGDEQNDEINELNASFRDEIRGLFEGFRGGGREKMEELREKTGALTEKFDEKVEEVLTEDQFVRLGQLQIQKLLSGGVAKALSSELGEQLDVTDELKQKLNEKTVEVKEWEKKEIARIRAESRKKMLSVLSDEMQAKLQELAGKMFDFGEEDRTRRGGGVGRGGVGRGGGGRLPGR